MHPIVYGSRAELTFILFQGASHSGWASKDKNLRDVVEVISSAQENLDVDDLEKRAGIVDEEASSESDNDSSDGGGKGNVPDGSTGDRQGPIDQIRDYKRREKALHRKHRGIMQWKVSLSRATLLDAHGSETDLSCRFPVQRSG